MKRSLWIAIAITLMAFAVPPSAEGRDKDKDKDKDCKKCEEQIKHCDFGPLIYAIEELEKCDFLSGKKARDQHEDLLEWAEEAEEEAEDCDLKDTLKKLEKIVRRLHGDDCDAWLTEDAADYISEVVGALLECLVYDETQCPHKDEEEDKDKCGHKDCRDKDSCKDKDKDDDKDKCDHKDCEDKDSCKEDKKKCDHYDCRGEDYCKKKDECGKCGDKHKGKECKRR